MTLEQVKEKYSYELINMIDKETESEIRYNDDRRKPFERRIGWKVANQISTERVYTWIKEAHEETVNIHNPISLARFIASVRQAKAWATIIGLA